MYLLRLVTLVAVGGALSAPLAAQGIPRNARTQHGEHRAPFHGGESVRLRARRLRARRGDRRRECVKR